MSRFDDRLKYLLCAAPLTCLLLTGACGLPVDGSSEALGSPSGSGQPPPACIPPFRELSELPTLHAGEPLQIGVDLAVGVRAPTAGRLALVAVVVDHARQNLFEIASVPLPTLPSTATLTLPSMPQEIIDLEAAALAALPGDPPPVQLDTYVVVYDDANGNGAMETGQDFSDWHPEQGAGTAGGGSALDLTPNFTGWSSPTDPTNEIVHLTRVHAVFSETGGYHFESIGDACVPDDLVDPTSGYVTTVGWSLSER